MRDGYYVNAHGEKVVQKMVNENDEPKGMKAVLEERGFDTSNLNRETMRELLSAQPDFKGQKCFLEVCTHGIVTAHTATLIFPAQELLERRGHRCVFFPKFHCELSPIEMVWASAKRCFRNNCKYEYGKGFKKLVVESLDSVTVHHMRAFDRHCHRYINVYTAGGDIAQAEIARASKKKTSHRVIPDNSDLVAKEAYREAWERPG